MNAIKFTARGGRVDIGLGAVGAHAQLRVADTGKGIDPSLMPHIFDGFRQGDASPSRLHGGLGLGLTIVKQFVELHGGNVKAVSGGAGHGSTFIVELPYRVDEPRLAPKTPPDASAVQRPQLRDSRILVIDDDRDATAMMQRFIEDQSGHVTTASTAEQALDLLTRQTFDVIVSDIAMPGGDGYDLISEIRSRGLATPAVAVTAFAHVEDRRRALAKGYQAHIVKPVDPAELLDAVVKLARAATPSRAVGGRLD